MATELDELRARVRAEADATAYDFRGTLEAVEATYIGGVPRKVRHRDNLSGRTGWSRESAEHDELDLLSPSELDRLRRNGWLGHETGKANRADLVLEAYADRYNLASIDDAWAQWLHATRVIDACAAVTAGRQPGKWAADCGYQWWHDVAPACAADGIDIRACLEPRSGTRAVDDETRGELVAAVRTLNKALCDYLDRLVFPPKKQYAELYAAHVVSGTPAPADPETAWAPDVRRKIDRYNRLETAA